MNLKKKLTPGGILTLFLGYIHVYDLYSQTSFKYWYTVVLWLKTHFAQFALITCDFSGQKHRKISPAKEKFKHLIGQFSPRYTAKFRGKNLIFTVKFRHVSWRNSFLTFTTGKFKFPILPQNMAKYL